MPEPQDLLALTVLFRTLGAPEPEEWARAQIEEGIPQLARFLFLRQAWRTSVSEDEHGWIDAAIVQAESRPNDPYAGVGQILRRLRSKGAKDVELTELARGLQSHLLFSFCCLLEDPGELEEAVSDVSWGLFQTDENGNIRGPIEGLHESVLETDPTGREVRPRPAV